jgi:DNA-directed RNA polymerase subunit L
MELKVLKDKDNELVVEVMEETVTVTNALRGELWEDKNISEAAQVKEHPYLAGPKIFASTSSGKPVTALDKAAERVIKQTEEFNELFKKAAK